MSVIVGAGVVAAIAAGYVGKKGWQAFHRAVGISPGTLKYVDPSKRPPPDMIQLSLAPHQLQYLPKDMVQQVLRIDDKADVYQQWREEKRQAGHTPSVSEETFVVQKLLEVRLPEMLNSYQRIAQQSARLQQTELRQTHQTADQEEALQLLSDLLCHIEETLDGLLKRSQDDSLQELQVMRRYLDERQ